MVDEFIDELTEPVENTKKKAVKRTRALVHRKGDSLAGKRYMVKILNSISEYMQENGYNFNYIAKKLCVSRSCISTMFSGRVVWTFVTLINVCDALDLDFELVLTPRKVKL